MKNPLTRIVGVGLAAVTLFSFAACGAGGSGASGGDADAKKITVMYADDQNNAYKRMGENYQKDSGVEVENMEVPYDDLSTKLSNASKANDLPDVARVPAIDPLWLDQLQDLKDVAEKENVMKSLIIESKDGQVLTIPSDLTAVGLFLNTTLFDKAGVSYPKTSDDKWTWDEFIDAITKVQDATGAKYGMVMDSSSHRERSFMYQFGSKADEVQADGTTTFDSQAKTALEYLKKIVNDKTMPKSIYLSNEDPSALFKTGQVAAYYSGNWQIADFINSISSFEWKSVVMPSQPVRATNIGTNYMVAFTPAGKKYLEWFFSGDNYKKFCEQGSYLSVETGVKPTYAERNDDMQMYLDEIQKSDQTVIAKQITQALQNSMDGIVGSGTDPLKEETIKYLAGEQDVDTALANMAKRYTEDNKGE